MFQAGGIISAFKKLKDRSYSITVETGELYPDQLAELDRLYQTVGFVLFGENPIDKMPDDITTSLQQGNEKKAKRKSKSQQLRNVMYVVREKNHKNQHNQDFDRYYEIEMEKIINHYHGKIDPIDI